MADLFKLPISSYEEVVKIIRAYSGAKEGTLQTLDDIAQSTKIDRTIVSANNGFMVQIGIITEGNKKGTTDTGRLLGRAYNSKVNTEVARIWCDLINENDFLNRMISAIRIRNGMDKTEFLNHIVYSSGQNNSSKTRAGAGTIIEIFKIAELITEVDGKLEINEPSDHQIYHDEPLNNMPIQGNLPISALAKGDSGAISININLDITCNAEKIDGLAEKIKQFIKEMSEEE